MQKSGLKVVVGCIVKKKDSILLVKHNYGCTKDLIKSALKSGGLIDSEYEPSGHPKGTLYWKSYTV